MYCVVSGWFRLNWVCIDLIWVVVVFGLVMEIVRLLERCSKVKLMMDIVSVMYKVMVRWCRR